MEWICYTPLWLEELKYKGSDPAMISWRVCLPCHKNTCGNHISEPGAIDSGSWGSKSWCRHPGWGGNLGFQTHAPHGLLDTMSPNQWTWVLSCGATVILMQLYPCHGSFIAVQTCPLSLDNIKEMHTCLTLVVASVWELAGKLHFSSMKTCFYCRKKIRAKS